jgi:hypothetical protein
MKNILGIFSASVIFTLSSCISTAQFNNAEDDVYYSPKASNRKQPVMIPEVNVDSIIRKNPPQYGQPTNRVDDVTPNPNAAAGYRAYRAQQDSLYQKDPTLSGYYVNPNLPNSETDESARRNNRWFRRSYVNGNRWDYGLGWNSLYGPGLSIGYGFNNNWGNNWGFNYGSPFHSWGYSPFFNNWNSGFGWNAGFGWNSGFGCGNPFFNNYWGYPGYGYGGYFPPTYYYPDNNSAGNGGSGNTGNQPISRPRPTVGGTTPPDNSGQYNGGRNYQAPQQSNEQPQPGANPNNGRAYTPTNGQQRLENVNGRVIYTRPQEVAPPVQTQTPSNSAPGYQQGTYNNTNQATPAMQRPAYNDSRGSYSAPPMNTGGGVSGGGRSGGGSSGGGSTGGRRR